MNKKLRGDGPCDDCGTVDNIVWYAPHPLWNFVMGGYEQRDDPGGILCIPCFVTRADARGVSAKSWMLTPMGT